MRVNWTKYTFSCIRFSNECARKGKRRTKNRSFFTMGFQLVMNTVLTAWTNRALDNLFLEGVWNYLPLFWVNFFHFVEEKFILSPQSHGDHRGIRHRSSRQTSGRHTRTKADIAWNRHVNTAQRGWQSNLSPLLFPVATASRLCLETRASPAISSGAKWQGWRRLEYA